MKFLTLTFRQFWRNRLFTALNIIGLSVGISASWIVYRIVSFENSFNTQIKDKDLIHQIVSRFEFDGKESGNAGVPTPFKTMFENDIPGIDFSVAVFRKNYQTVKVIQNAKAQFEADFEANANITTSNYFKLVNYSWLAGSPEKCLNEPKTMVLTDKKAQLYFPNTKPIDVLGRVVTFNDSLNYTITGVVKTLEYPADFNSELFFSFNKKNRDNDNWGSTSSDNLVFVKLKQGTEIANVMKLANAIATKNSAEKLKEWKAKRWHLSIPLSEIHFATDYGSNSRQASKTVLNTLLGIAGFLLLLAAINYINMAIAQIPSRAKEIGIRKTLGSSKGSLILRFLGETLILVLVSFGFSLLLTNVFFHFFDFSIPKGMFEFTDYQSIAFFSVAFILLVTLLTGIYPGIIISRFQPVEILKGSTISTVSGGLPSLKKGLIIFQFFVANVFIIGAFVMSKQLNFMIHKELGFDQNAVVTIDVPYKYFEMEGYKDKHFTLKQELKAMKEVKAVGLGNPLLSNSFSSNTYGYSDSKGKLVEQSLYRKNADEAIQKVYDLKLLAGRNVTMADTVREYVLNETAIKGFGFKTPQDAIGKFITEQGKSIPIVGVVNDFHSASFYDAINPIVFVADKNNLSCFNLKLSATDSKEWPLAIEKIKAVWSQFYPKEAFKAVFYEEVIDELYESEQQMAMIVNLATFITILISCLGLFGLSTFATIQRSKEIGIRKVLGASANSIIALLSKDFLILVLIGFILASPFAYYLAKMWLDKFVFHIPITVWFFMIAGLLALVIALLTVSYQSVKAALMNPVTSLKTE